MSNLWPEDITEDLVDTPVTLLNKYAGEISQSLDSKIVAEVRRRNYNALGDLNKTVSQLTGNNIKPTPGPKFYYIFEIVAPSLDNYRYELFVISFDTPTYPAKLYLDEDILKEIEPSLEDEYYGPLTVNDSSEMETMLNHILNAPKTITIIRSLLSLINESQINGVPH
ncbi:MAG: hypothetical protein AAF702_04955 [Chloroflexota bacterium]